MRSPAVVAAAVLALGACGCGEKKSDDARPLVKPGTRRSASPSEAGYERYHALWWITHADLESAVARKMRLLAVDEKFERTIASLKSMGKVLVGEGKERVESYVGEYEKLQVSARAKQASRRLVDGLQRIKMGITRQLAPDNIDPALRKGR